ncbi:MAG: hypothetical protein QM775_29935 [Pirellulales bacterium]
MLGGKQRLVLQAITDTSTAKHFTSLKKAGITEVMYHVESDSVDPNNSGTTVRVLVSGDQLPTLNGASTEAGTILRAIYPESFDSTGAFIGFPTGVIPVVLGLGPSSTAVGNSIVSAPMATDDETTNYDRFLVVFNTYADGRHARLKAVLEPHGEVHNAMITKFQTESKMD